MMKLQTADRKACRLLRAAFQDALRSVESELGVTIDVGGMSYNPNEGSVNVKVTAMVDAVTGGKPKAEIEFRQDAELFGLKPDMFGAKFTSKGKEFTISGLKPRSPKYPILADDASGKTYKFTLGAVRASMALANAGINL